MSDFQPRRLRLRLNADSYRKLRTEVLERGRLAMPVLRQLRSIFRFTTFAREAGWGTTQTKI